jgi:hypothetical protein
MYFCCAVEQGVSLAPRIMSILITFCLMKFFFVWRVCPSCIEVNWWSGHIADIAPQCIRLNSNLKCLFLHPQTHILFLLLPASNMWMHRIWKIIVVCTILISAFQNVRGCTARGATLAGNKVLTGCLPSVDSGTTRNINKICHSDRQIYYGYPQN